MNNPGNTWTVHGLVPGKDGTDTVWDFERESDILNFSGMSAIDVVVVVAHTQFRAAAVTFGQGDLLMTVRDVTGFNNAIDNPKRSILMV